MRVYAIGDVHGQLDKLREAHRRIEADGGADATVAHLGDLVDRGPDSRGVVQLLIDGQAAGRDWIALLGNHDRMLSRFLTDPGWIDPGLSQPRHWLDHPGLGAAATVASYGLDPAMGRDRLHEAAMRVVPADHVRWLRGLPRSFLHPAALFVHAGIRPGVDLQDQSEDDCVWIRAPFLESDADFGPLVVHGHTVVDAATHYGNRVNLDTGAGYGRALTAAVIEQGAVWTLGENGREPVRAEPRT